MDPFSFAPMAAALQAGYALIQGIALLLYPVTDSASAAFAVVVLTLLVRVVLIPVGVSQVKAEWGRRKLAPRLQVLQRKYKARPELLQRKVAALYKSEHVSQFAGMLPTLMQAPVVTLVYALFIRADIGGTANALLGEHLGGVALGTASIHAGWPGIVVFVALFAIIAIVAWFSRRTALRLALPQQDASAAAITTQKVFSWLPFITVPIAAFVPLAAALYLATTTLWTLVERAILRRRYWAMT